MYNTFSFPIVVPEIVFSAPVGGYVVNETFAVTFMCNATGIPPPTIQWYRDQTLLSGTMGSDFSGTELNSRVVVNEPTIESSLGEVSSVSRSLTVMNAMDGDTGTFSCEATNEAMGGIDTEEFELFVQGKSWYKCRYSFVPSSLMLALSFPLQFLPLLLLLMMTRRSLLMSQSQQCSALELIEQHLQFQLRTSDGSTLLVSQ